MKTILVPLDGSPIAQQVLPYARLLAPLLKARVRLLCAVSDFEPEALRAAMFEAIYRGVPLGSAHSWEEALRQRVVDYLDEQAAQLQAAGVDTEVVLQPGRPADVIVEAAEQEDVALVVMGTHGYSGLRRWALGSVTDKVVHASSRPVFVVRATEAAPFAPPALRRVLVPLDGSPLARTALPPAIELAGSAHAELLLLTTAAPPIDEAPWDAQPLAGEAALMATLRQQLLAETHDVADLLAAAKVEVTPIAAPGLAADAILSESVRQGVDVIVMATHGYGGLRRWALGSVADKVLQASTVPLLLVRPMVRGKAHEPAHATPAARVEAAG